MRENADQIRWESGGRTEAETCDEIAKASLPVVYGIAVDKAERLTRVREQPGAAENLVASVLSQLQASGGRVKLEVEVPRTIEAQAEVVDAGE